MAKVIAVCGKGGVGKTTISGLIVRLLKEKGLSPILAVDADPSMNLNMTLGVHIGETVGNIREDAKPEKGKRPQAMSLTEYFELQVNLSLQEADSFDLLVMGRPEGKGCYCSANSNLREALKKLTSTYRYVVIDNEAGMEHISRQTDGSVDIMLIVSDPTPKGLVAAMRTDELISRLENEVKKRFLVINRVSKEMPLNLPKEMQIPLVGYLRIDPILSEIELAGKSIFELPTNAQIYQDLQDILKGIDEDING
ncbi:MAG: AAA family ATPase [bacterium]|nr:AAA family ATPase [bacterium]